MTVSKKMATMFLYLLVCAAPAIAADNHEGEIRMVKLEDPNPFPRKLNAKAVLGVNESYQYYDIEGSSLDELQRKMRTSGTRWNDGKVYAALTTWDISYKYDVEKKDGRYVISSISTDVGIIYRYPRWTPATATPPQVTQSWNSYMEKLIEHEFGHKDLAVKAAADVNELLSTLGSFTSKSALKAEAERLVRTRLKQMKDVQVAYDDETQHGQTQGAVLR